ncbi:methyltransferase-like protein [Hypomontagnella submonticulosa]|nr:methyltransferase-like protein [Hypomontagnella submonticulosa]
MASAEVLQNEYNDQATKYDDSIISTPVVVLETQLLASALGDCTGLAVLDLGGGSGLRARQVLDLGAASVDLVDMSREMMEHGKKGKYGDRINWYEGDVSKSLAHLPLKKYDLVMANWVMDHAASLAALEGMWTNVAAYLKPGGRFVGTRSGDPNSPAARDFTYGVRYKDQQPIPGGVRYRYESNTTPSIDIEGASMEISYSGSTELHTKHGLVDVEMEPYEKTEAVRKDPEFWKPFLDHPFMAVIKAKRGIIGVQVPT